MSETIDDGKSTTVAVNNGAEAEEEGTTIATTTTTTPATSNTPAAEDGSRTPRLPRWTRHEILVLIQGKKVAENRVRRGRTGTGSSSAFGSNPLEPKWASVSSYCKRHGVNRGPVQCRKRWSNLAGDFKKIKEWETQILEETESFWVMRNDLRKERKLPGFFDREVYDILDGGVVAPLAATGDVVEEDVTMTTTVAEEEEEGRRVDDGVEPSGSGGGGGQGESHKETSSNMIPPPLNQPNANFSRFQVTYKDSSASQGPTNETQAQTSNPGDKQAFVRSSEDGTKRRRLSPDRGQGGGSGGNGAKDQHISMQEHLIKVLEMNNRMLTAQLEAQNLNSQLDREQRTNDTNSLVAVISKLADSISKIADKL
ncbi:hypothetical protein MKW94_027607 [Papaver nudicaule]|uniref:Myb-like domain-containing protein n=1 Tax=Papaver nudicaule TaxID=74823 RepID=A0AA41VAW6_PAPNU|nr:hypothetical protein [Papaver nudicaule]